MEKPSGDHIPLGGFVSSIAPFPSAGMVGQIIRLSVSLVALSASLLVLSWIGLALLGF